MTIETIEDHENLIDALIDPACWPQGGGDRRRIDTHISTVVLAGEVAYKIKKPLDLGFLDFRSLQARKFACEEELRINRRLAPHIYQAVCAITGSPTAPLIDAEGDAIDWAVRMQRFDPDAVLSNPALEIDDRLIDRLAETVAAFHASAPVADGARSDVQSSNGNPPELSAVLANFHQLKVVDGSLLGHVRELESWTLDRAQSLRPLLRQRRQHGCVRECHGDLHLGNVALIDGDPVVFDAIEFDPDLRWIDVANDIAFLTMDLHQRDMRDSAYRFVDRYLSATGDYAALRLLQFYEVYRALVRAKIAAIRLQQVDDGEQRAKTREELERYLTLAIQLAAPRRGALLITHGVSGSGKSYASAGLSQQLHGVRLRSDVERKRLLGLAPEADAAPGGGYDAGVTARTYRRLLDLAREVIEAGYPVIVDATFLDRADRVRFADLAAKLCVPFAILDCEADPDILRARITARQSETGNVSDADLAVLEAQLARAAPLTPDERAVSLSISPGRPLDLRALAALLAHDHQSA